jgi:hypothetical protein
MISLNDFEVLPFEKQCDFITVFADYILNRTELDKKHYLYFMDDYFVEVSYLPLKGKVQGIKAFKKVELAEAYFEHIDISDLYM